MSEDSDSKLLFRVDTIKFDDLYDWSVNEQKGKLHRVTGRNLRRTNSTPSGSLAHINDEKLALFRFGSVVYAVKEKCPHMGGPLHMGDIEVLPDLSLCVRCPWHSWCIELSTGRVREPRGKRIITQVYSTKVDDDGNISIAFDHFSERFFSDDIKF
ncbi:LOW QUALITY PROTEIN: Rieske domain-containing protein-like [Amphiura filiformis]|uniref:LOW QUALITY PROTEIN: Rieske domain-containing protein-like n=1 Tax=Amphiura filiformis TaxID=82378 RepID=UPI003B212884